MIPPGARPAPRVAFKSIGCRTNQEEMATLRGELEQDGYTVVDDLKIAGIIIVNTCSVTSLTETKTRRLLRGISREAPHGRILVTGCLAQQEPGEFKAFGNVSWVVGNARKHEIPRLLRETDGGIFFSEITGSPLVLSGSVPPPVPEQRTRFPVKIQEGCNFRCAYCIVPFLRGPARSASLSAVIDTCARALDAGYKEIVLTGTHIGQYRGEAGQGLITLLDRLLQIGGDFRVRLSSLDPRELTDELCDIVGNGKKMCEHLHLSLQSLSPEVLRMMSRPYASFETIVERLLRFRAKYPYAGLGADFIVGFPGETPGHFAETAGCAERIGFSYAHLFRFSARPGTAAAVLTGKISEPVKTERSECLRAVINAGRERFVRKQCGRTHRIIVEQGSPVRGLTSNYLSVEDTSFSALHNSWIDVIIDGTRKGSRFCCKVPSNPSKPETEKTI